MLLRKLLKSLQNQLSLLLASLNLSQESISQSNETLTHSYGLQNELSILDVMTLMRPLIKTLLTNINPTSLALYLFKRLMQQTFLPLNKLIFKL